jgi:Tfp pilus assembly protein PilF
MNKKLHINFSKPSQKQLKSLINYYQTERYVEAEKLSLSLTKDFPKHQLAWKVLALILKQNEKISEALIAIQKSVQLEPRDSNTHYNLAVILLELKRLDEAEVSFRKTIELKPDHAEAHINLGTTLGELGRLDEAETSYRKTIELKPDYADAHNNLGTILRELGRLDESEESYNIAVNLEPRSESILMNRSQIYFDKGKFELSLKDVDNCNNPISRARSLRSLYALGRIDEIYERIKKNSQLDEMNISVAAFSSFISIKEGKETANNFCKNPVDFIHYSNLKNHLKDSDLFINEIIKELNTVKTEWEPFGKSTIKGFQSKNLFKSSLIKINDLKSIILREIDSYYSKFKNMICTYIEKWPSKKNLRSWHVVLKKKGYQGPHIHRDGWLSGVIYLKVVPHLKKNEGAIEFSLNGEYYFDEKSPKIIHKPIVGDIILFPSSLHHRTIPFTTDEDRIIISFDLLPNTKKISVN